MRKSKQAESLAPAIPAKSPVASTDLALLRELDIIGDRRRGIPALFPVSRTEWRAGCREGRYPKPVRLPGQNKMTFWRRADVLALLSTVAEVQR